MTKEKQREREDLEDEKKNYNNDDGNDDGF